MTLSPMICPTTMRGGGSVEAVMKSPRSFIPAFLLVALVAAMGFGMPAHAQSRDDVLLALERTDDLIARAQELVAGSDNAQAQEELSFAIRLQTDAKANFAGGRLRIAVDLTMRARLHADRAIAIIKGLPDPDRVLAQLERTRELLDRARERIEECNSDRARSRLRAAVEMQERAEASAREGRYLAALQLTLSARERAHQALRLCNLEENLKESAERALARTDELIARAREVVRQSDVEGAHRALDRAVEVEAEAWTQFRAEHFEASLRLTQSARTFAHRAIRLAGAR